MNRKDFLSAVVPLVSVATAFGETAPKKSTALNKIPPYLKKGDTIGITCPSGYISLDECEPAINKMQEWGFNIRVGDTVGLKNFHWQERMTREQKNCRKCLMMMQ